jgi:uncharacterized protein YjbI with pentapeptide repeats
MANAEQLAILKAGVEGWNTWREANPDAGLDVAIDLTGADLRDAILSSANLRDADLYGANFSGADLRQVDMTDANMGSANMIGVIR